MLMLSHFKGHAMGGLGSREYEIVNLDQFKNGKNNYINFSI